MGYHYRSTHKNGKSDFERVFRVENRRDWLHSMGGRTFDDVIKDENGLFVEMTTYDGSNKVYIPTKYLL